MNRQTPPRAAKQPLPIHWLIPSAFNIPIPRDEKQRLAALDRYDILDTPPERTFDSIAVLASHVCAAPIALLVLIDRNRQWSKAKVGVRRKETPREFAFCAHTIMQRALFIIPDATKDRRFASNPLIVSGPQYRFYAGAPLVTPDNRALGTLCVMDKVHRTLTDAQKKDLLALSRLVMTELELPPQTSGEATREFSTLLRETGLRARAGFFKDQRGRSVDCAAGETDTLPNQEYASPMKHQL